jgi:hypothetical protein
MLTGFTGIDSEYQPPLNPDLVLNAGEEDEAECLQKLIRFLYKQGIIPKEVSIWFDFHRLILTPLGIGRLLRATSA